MADMPDHDLADIAAASEGWNDLAAVIEACRDIVDPEEWSDSPLLDDMEHDGENADGQPTIGISVSLFGGYCVRWSIGWYEQRGDADTPADVARLLRAFASARRALDAALDEVDHG